MAEFRIDVDSVDGVDGPGATVVSIVSCKSGLFVVSCNVMFSTKPGAIVVCITDVLS